MKSLFTPAIALMNRLGYTKKFSLLALVSTVAFAVVVYGFYDTVDKETKTARRELEGLALIKPISQAVQSLQLHRGLSVVLLSDNETMRARRAVKERETSQAFEAMNAKLPPEQRETEGWRNIEAGWERLRKDGLGMTASDNFAAHTRLIARILIFQVAVADEYALTLDPLIDTYYLIDTAINKLPSVLEHLGQLRAYGSGILVKKQHVEKQRENIFKIIGMLDDALPALEVNLEKTGRYNPAMRGSLLAMSGDIKDSVQRVIGIIESDILTGHFTTSPEGYFALTTGVMDASYRQLYESLLPMTATLLEARIARAENMLHASIGLALLLLLIVTYFAIGIYYSIVGNVQSLARSARAFAAGDLRERIHLGTRDEIGLIGDSFNEIADSFNALLAARKQAEAHSVLLLESVNSGIVGVDTAGNISFVNPAAVSMLGYALEELVGQPLYEMMHHSYPNGSPYPREICPIYQMLADGQSRNVAAMLPMRCCGARMDAVFRSNMAHILFIRRAVWSARWLPFRTSRKGS